jgi:hypothetical protein
MQAKLGGTFLPGTRQYRSNPRLGLVVYESMVKSTRATLLLARARPAPYLSRTRFTQTRMNTVLERLRL